MDYQWWVVAHILGAGYWLGTDLAVYYTAGTIADRAAPLPARLWAARTMLLLDMVPRTCLILTFAIGLTLATRLGALPMLSGWLPLLWLAALAWLVLTWSVFRLEHSPLGHHLARADFALRVLVVLGCACGTWLLWQGTDSLARSPWLALKFAIAGGIVALGLLIRVQLAPFGALFGKVASAKATLDDEDTIARLIARVKVPVWFIWAGVIAAIVLGRFKPQF